MLVYTQEQIEEVSQINFYAKNDELLFWRLKSSKIIDMHLSTFKEKLALHRKNRLDNYYNNKELSEEKRLEIEFYEAVDVLKATGIGSQYMNAYTGALEDKTGKTSIDFINKVYHKGIEETLSNETEVINPNIDLLRKAIKLGCNHIHKDLFVNHSRFVGLIGGAGSGKTTDMVRYRLDRLISDERKNLLVLRRFKDTLKDTIYPEFIHACNDLGILTYQNDTNKVLRIRVSNERREQVILFKGCDAIADIEKLKGLKTDDGFDFTDVHIEECSEFKQDVFDLLPTRIRTSSSTSLEIGFTTNTVRGASWLKERFYDNIDDNYKIITSTYRDNLNLGKDYLQNMDNLKEINYQLWLQYANGEWISLGDRIFGEESYKIWTGELTSDWQLMDMGLDAGYITDKSAVVEAYRRRAEDGILTIDGYEYLFKEIFYTPTKTIDMIADKLDSMGVDKNTFISCESTPPDIVEILRNRGYNAHPVQKGAGSIMKGIYRLLSMQPYLLGANLIREVESYEWDKDKNGITIERPNPYSEDHLIDAMRYAINTPLVNINNFVI